MTARHFGLSARGSHAHIDYRAPHAQSPGNDCNLNQFESLPPPPLRLVRSSPAAVQEKPALNSSAMGILPCDPWSDLARPARPFLQFLRDLALIGVGVLIAWAFFTALGLLGYAACLYFVPEFVQH